MKDLWNFVKGQTIETFDNLDYRVVLMFKVLLACFIVSVLAGVFSFLLDLLLGPDKKSDPVNRFLQALRGIVPGVILSAAGAALINHYQGMSWFFIAFRWCWWWWDGRWASNIIWNVIVVVFCGGLSSAATLILFSWTILAGAGWLSYRALVFVGTTWWSLATLSEIGTMIASLLAVGVMVLGHFMLRHEFGVNPVFPLTARAADALVLMASRVRRTPAAARAKKGRSMTEDDISDDPEIQKQWRTVEPYLKRMHDAMPELGNVPIIPTAFRGYFNAARERALVRSGLRNDTLKIEHLEVINKGLAQVILCEE